MGAFFVAATEDDAFGELPGELDAPGIGEPALASLGVVVGAGLYDELITQLDRTRDPALGDADVVRLPRKLRDALSETGDIPGTAERWAASDELADEPWDTEDAVALLEELTQLARDAREAGIDLWYRWSVTEAG